MEFNIGDNVILSHNKTKLSLIGLEKWAGTSVIITNVIKNTRHYCVNIPAHGIVMVGVEHIDKIDYRTRYFTNPQKRCSICDAREVVTIVGTNVTTNLKKFKDNYYCKDEKECKKNINAEKTKIEVEVDDENKRLVYKEDGKEMLELQRRD